MSRDHHNDKKPIVRKSIRIKWPCGHELVRVDVELSRESEYFECPYCLVQHFLECYEDDKDKLDDEKWKELVNLAKNMMDNL